MTLWHRRGRWPDTARCFHFACLGFVTKINSFKTWTDFTEMQKSSKKKQTTHYLECGTLLSDSQQYIRGYLQEPKHSQLIIIQRAVQTDDEHKSMFKINHLTFFVFQIGLNTRRVCHRCVCFRQMWRVRGFYVQTEKGKKRTGFIHSDAFPYKN